MSWKAVFENPRAQKRMVKYQVWTYDVWGNERDGFEVNDRYKQGTVEIEAVLEHYNVGTPHASSSYNVTDEAVIKALKSEGYISKNIRKSSIGIDGEPEYSLYIEYTPTARPEMELQNLEPEKLTP